MHITVARMEKEQTGLLLNLKLVYSQMIDFLAYIFLNIKWLIYIFRDAHHSGTYGEGADGSPAKFKTDIPPRSLILKLIFFLNIKWLIYIFRDAHHSGT